MSLKSDSNQFSYCFYVDRRMRVKQLVGGDALGERLLRGALALLVLGLAGGGGAVVPGVTARLFVTRVDFHLPHTSPFALLWLVFLLFLGVSRLGR